MALENGVGKWHFKQHWKRRHWKMVLENGVGKRRWKMVLENGVGKRCWKMVLKIGI
jgi:hypothetical protein